MGLNHLYAAVRWIIGLIFVVAGGMKLAAPDTFAVLIGAYGILPPVLVMPAAVLLPAAEVAAGAALMADIRGSLTVVTLLLAVFMAILAYGMWMGLDVDCGCFGPEDPEASAFHGLRRALVRDALMMGAVLFLYWWRWRSGVRPVPLGAFSSRKQSRYPTV